MTNEKQGPHQNLVDISPIKPIEVLFISSDPVPLILCKNAFWLFTTSQSPAHSKGGLLQKECFFKDGMLRIHAFVGFHVYERLCCEVACIKVTSENVRKFVSKTIFYNLLR